MAAKIKCTKLQQLKLHIYTALTFPQLNEFNAVFIHCKHVKNPLERLWWEVWVVFVREREAYRYTKCSEELSLPCEPGMNPGINELKIKQRALGGKNAKLYKTNYIRRWKRFETSAKHSDRWDQVLLQQRTLFRQRGSEMLPLLTVV